MAPSKRPRPADLEEQESSEGSEVIDVESARSNFRQDKGKRVRLSYDGSSDAVSDESSEDMGMDEEQETQFRTQQQSGNSVDNAAADNGILESVSCANFMCHTYLEVALGPLINFIIGHNGSGKSAILTAITICLGGKATATNRGQSLKSFIKEGTESATLSVKIKNKGDSAYQSDVYGESIIVERHFTRSGTSNFRLRSASGRLISIKKADLEEICDYFALQIDNPMNVLTQDMARQFLSNSTPQEKYKFFMKGTQLEHLDGDYLQIEQCIDRMDQDLAKSLADVGHYEEEARKAKTTLALSDKNESLRAKWKEVGYQMAWAQVEEVEKQKQLVDDMIAQIVDQIVAAERKAEACADRFTAADQAHDDAVRQVEEHKANLLPFEERKDTAKRAWDEVKEEALSVQSQQRAIKDGVRRAKAEVKSTEEKIQEEYRRLEEVNGGSNVRRLAEMDEKRSQLASARSRREEHEAGLSDLQAEQRRALQSLEQSKDPLPIKRREVQACEDRLNRLIKDQGKQDGAYHTNIPRLLRSIREDGTFQQKPVGPIGYHVRLMKPGWSSILEKSFGAVLNTFIVMSKGDQMKLSSLMARTQCQCPILIGNNGRVETTGHEPDLKFDTSLRVLEIDEDLVRKQLIINQLIEQTILIENRPEAVNIMSEGRLENVKQCFTHNVKPGTGIRYSYGHGGGLSQTFVGAFQGPPRMKTDVEYQINDSVSALILFKSNCKAERDRLRSELHDLEQTVRECQTNLKSCEQAITRQVRQIRELKVEMDGLDEDILGLQEVIDRDSLEEGKLDEYKKQLEGAKQTVATQEAQFGDAVLAADRARDAMKPLRDQMKAIDDEAAEVKAKIEKAEKRRMEKSLQRDAALREKNGAFNEIDNARTSEGDARAKSTEKQETIDLYTNEAKKICPRVPVDKGETCGSLEKKLEKLQADLQRADSRLGGSRQELGETAARKVRAFQQAKAQVARVEKLAQLLKMTLVHRKERWKVFQRAITARARVQFMWMLSERSFRGRLLANHKEKKLDLNVEPDPTKVGKGREAKTLSGGEKSFSTICLLLSLWDAMGAPVRCLDEFDVFMDSVNREVSMRKMVTFPSCAEDF
ncbi:MAG: hypothetical protein Q9174_000493 [Haloplaca sp. 1 TL-2023]